MSKVLITGGAGFIGSYLAEYCIKMGDSVTIVDSLSTGSYRNLDDIKHDLIFLHSPVPPDFSTQIFFDNCQFNQIYHLAANVGFFNVLEEPGRKMYENIRGSNWVFDYAKRQKAKVLFTSSSEVYGERFSCPFKEDDRLILGNPNEMRWGYAYSKLVSEYDCLQCGARSVVVRLFNTIGKRQTGKYGMVVPRFVEQVKNNEVVQIYGIGEQTRCFCNVKDVVEALFWLMNTDNTSGEIYNVGSVEEISIMDLMLRIRDVIGQADLKFKLVPYSDAYGCEFNDVMRRVPSIKKVSKAIGWIPRVNLINTLKEIIGDGQV